MKELHLDIEDLNKVEEKAEETIDTLHFAGECIKKLLFEVKRLRKENKQLKAALEELTDHFNALETGEI